MNPMGRYLLRRNDKITVVKNNGEHLYFHKSEGTSLFNTLRELDVGQEQLSQIRITVEPQPPSLVSLIGVLSPLLVSLVWIVLALIALIQLRRRNLPAVAQALWSALIVVVPLLGAIAFLIVNPFE